MRSFSGSRLLTVAGLACACILFRARAGPEDIDTLAELGVHEVIHQEGTLGGSSAAEEPMRSAEDVTPAAPGDDGASAPSRRLRCSGVGSLCWVNAQCCSGRCIATHRCGPRVR
mmetsp:Transcript_29898/g.85292  ORF Transcript_29898/g.85292 Transcript_29898/m.85292 type:complete len:114 (+) Transcript_29898:127-468(+)